MGAMAIDEIRIGKRHRKDLGDIERLAQSIADLGLLHPVVVRPDGALIAGERRIAACRVLGWQTIPVTTIDLEDVVRGEFAENAERKDFTITEALDIAAALEPMEREAAKERMLAGVSSGKITEGHAPQALDRVAAAVGMSRPTLVKAREVVAAAEAEPERFGEVLEQMDSTGNVSRAHKEMRAVVRQEERRMLAEKASALSADSRWRIDQADMQTYEAGQRFDFIITDPPYPKEYLPLYETLALRALDWLKPGGLLLAMCGQSYLDAIMAMMGRHLEYYWTGCYLTPGQSASLRQKQVNTQWKPILVYGLPGDDYKGKIFSDVWVSEGNDKDLHMWGQSESGMYEMVKQVCLPGQSIIDPFCGAGTTGVAALRHGCTFRGVEIDAQNADIARARLAGVQA